MLNLAGVTQPRPRRLGQADAETKELQDAVADVAQKFMELAGRLEADLELALNTERYVEVPIIGETFNQVNVLATIDNVAERISGAVLNVLNPPLGAYATAASTAVLSEVDGRMKAIRNTISEMTGPLSDDTISGDDVATAEAYADSYLAGVMDVILALEKLVVVKENGNIPVREPDENARPNLLAMAGIAGVVVLLVAVSS